MAKQWCPPTSSADVKPVVSQQLLSSEQTMISDDSKLMTQAYLSGDVQQYTYNTAEAQNAQQYVPASPVKATDYSSKTAAPGVERDGFPQGDLSSPIKQELVNDGFPTCAPQDQHVTVGGASSQLTTHSTLNPDALMFDQVSI